MSEFGKGLAYNLGLFLAHAMQDYCQPEEIKKSLGVTSWFYGCADHFFEFEAEQAPEIIRERCIQFRDKMLKWRLPMNEKDNPTEKDKEWAINEAKELLLEIDKLIGIEPEKGDWE